MCGIAGIVGLWNGSSSPQLLEGMRKVLKHRGPDDFGYLLCCNQHATVGRTLELGTSYDLACAHLRLSILDLSPAGWQPMCTQDGRYALLFNGEIYNYLELRKELEAEQIEFHTHSDTEVLLQALVLWGDGAFQKLVGMFALAFVNTVQNTLLLARDFYGIKPLYFSKCGSSLAFASEIKAILTLPGRAWIANPETLFKYLRWGRTSNGRETMVTGIEQLNPGTCMTVHLGNGLITEPRSYWLPQPRLAESIPFEDAVQTTRDLLLDSVRIHLRSDVRIGAALSGGVDSSGIVGMISALQPDVELRTFSFIARGTRFSEERWIDEVTRGRRILSYKICPSLPELQTAVENSLEAQDEPFSSMSVIAQNLVFRKAACEGVKVMLDGQGADEIFGGYDLYRGVRLAQLLRSGDFAGSLRFLSSASEYPDSPPLRLLSWTGEFLLPDKAKVLFRKLSGKGLVPSWMNSFWFNQNGVKICSPRSMRPGMRLQELLHDELFGMMLGDLLRYEDRNSMFYSIESRVPFLNPQITNFISRLPDSYLMSPEGETKNVLRHALKPFVPSSVLERREKFGFEAPQSDWLRALLPDIQETLQEFGWQDLPFLAGGKTVYRALVSHENSLSVMEQTWWRWYNLARWSRRHHVSLC